MSAPISPQKTPTPSKGNLKNGAEKEVDHDVRPDFIYGGPFLEQETDDPFIDTKTPVNLQLQATFKKSFAYFTMKDRIPIILTKVIDYLAREPGKAKATGANDGDIQKSIKDITKLKNDVMTNKKYVPLTVDTPEAKRWNGWIEEADASYFTGVWVFSECYVYRRLREIFEINKSMSNFDPFKHQKEDSFTNNLENMCLVADQLNVMLQETDKDKRKQNLVTLLKVCLWSNKCDLSLKPEGNAQFSSDPFKMILDNKDKLLVDDAGKAADIISTRAEAMSKLIDANANAKMTCSCTRLATAMGVKVDQPAEGKPKGPPATPADADGETAAPCPTKMTAPSVVTFDIVCDNAGYELFADLCVAHFLVAHNIVKRVRFHVKKIPWFVSDVTPADFKHLVNACAGATYKKEIPAPAKPEPADGAPAAEPDPPTVICADNLTAIAKTWQAYVENGTFLALCDDFWTYPHTFKDMKKVEPNLYRKLQFAAAVMVKGDLNYRKLLGEKNWNPTTGFEAALQGFIPAPIIALRTVKAELICGLPNGLAQKLNTADPKWMESGDYGVIQLCPKAEPLKPSDIPCQEYGRTCCGTVCEPAKEF